MGSVAECLERHAQRPPLVTRALGAIKNVAADAANQRAVLEDCALGAVVDAMRAHGRNPDVQVAGMRARFFSLPPRTAAASHRSARHRHRLARMIFTRPPLPSVYTRE